MIFLPCRQELRERAEKAKHDLMLKAKEVAAQELDRLQGKYQNLNLKSLLFIAYLKLTKIPHLILHTNRMREKIQYK